MSFVEFSGVARLDRRTKRLVKRLGPDDIAIIDHRDIDASASSSTSLRPSPAGSRTSGRSRSFEAASD
jgi:uncharacterized membrane-anchored protein